MSELGFHAKCFAFANCSRCRGANIDKSVACILGYVTVSREEVFTSPVGWCKYSLSEENGGGSILNPKVLP